MHIEKIVISKVVLKKIFDKHSILSIEIEETLFDGNPIYFRTRDDKYLGIGNKFRYITIVFIKEGNYAKIITAYPSSKWQRKLYKRKI